MEYYILTTYLIGIGMQIKQEKFDWLIFLLSPIFVPIFIGYSLTDDYPDKK